jgi:hypothetical protein
MGENQKCWRKSMNESNTKSINLSLVDGYGNVISERRIFFVDAQEMNEQIKVGFNSICSELKEKQKIVDFDDAMSLVS